MRSLRNSQSTMAKKYVGPFQQSLSGIIAKAEDSGSDDPYFSDEQAKSVGLRLLKRGTNTSKSSGSLRSSSSVRSVELFDQNIDDDEDQLVLMRSLGTKTYRSPIGSTPSPARPTSAVQKSVSFAPKSTAVRPVLSTSLSAPLKSDPAPVRRISADRASYVGESIIVLGSEEKESDSLRLRTSQSSKSSHSRSSRYSPSDEASDYDDYTSESKGSTAYKASSKGDISFADSSDAKDNSDTIDTSEFSGSKVRSKTLDSTISELTLSGIIQEGKVDLKKRLSQEFEGDRRAQEQSADLSKSSGRSPVLQEAELKKAPTVSTTQTPLTNSSTISPFADLRDNDDDDASESLALSESNDAFPFLEESQED